MSWYILKIIITTLLIVVISEIAKSTLVGAILASIPLVSVLAMIWLYIDTKDVARISDLATSVFWLVLPSLVLFIALPVLLQQGLNFYLSLALASLLTIVSYFVMLNILGHFGIKL